MVLQRAGTKSDVDGEGGEDEMEEMILRNPPPKAVKKNPFKPRQPVDEEAGEDEISEMKQGLTPPNQNRQAILLKDAQIRTKAPIEQQKKKVKFQHLQNRNASDEEEEEESEAVLES